ncbi:hypothetical protein GOV09_06145 [Candidatus Woesearchaeota archaeon]|nr:hypothetical protein [Candidatus Woesearchaeota archaeon]
MRYDLKKLQKVVERYKKSLGKIKGKSVLVSLGLDQKKAYYSLAPLSQAVDELGGDISVFVYKGRSGSLAVLEEVWKTYNNLQKGVKNKKTKALKEFILLADGLCKGELGRIFKAPEIVLRAGKNGFSGTLPFDMSWMKEYRQKDLVKTGKVVFKQVYDLKKKERVSIGFTLLRKKAELGLPVEDYLDNFQICYAMMRAVRKHKISMAASSARKTQLDDAERVSELKTTLLGCELSKQSDELIFKKFNMLSSLLRINRMEVASAVFGTRGKGYRGKHIFGEYVGYPAPGNKTRWSSPARMMFKLDFDPQTRLDPRKPLSRIAFTETLPIDIFIKTSFIDWLAMAKRDWKIRNIGDKSEYIIVKGKKFGKYQTDLKVGLVGKHGRRYFRGSDVATRHLIQPKLLKKGIKAGTMANIPGGEGFVTPEYVKGQFIGDVVISLDQSYRLDTKRPIVVNCKGNTYKIVDGPSDILKKFQDKRNEGMKALRKQEKNKSLPREIIEIQKKNFMNIGEFAINTNPKAELCNYLIVNEKIAHMIHIALGSGFEPDRASVYHTDIVINAPRQQLDIYGIEKNGKRHWIHKKGKFVI